MPYFYSWILKAKKVQICNTTAWNSHEISVTLPEDPSVVAEDLLLHELQGVLDVRVHQGHQLDK